MPLPSLMDALLSANSGWIAKSDAGRCGFSVALFIDDGSEIAKVTLQRGFDGNEMRLWGAIRSNLAEEVNSSDFRISQEIDTSYFRRFDARNCAVTVSKIFDSGGRLQPSIDRISFESTDGTSLVISSDVDSFEVPCLRTDIFAETLTTDKNGIVG